jgi:antitoxin FitA
MRCGDIMPSLQIRDIPEDVYNALAERANTQRRSLAQQAIAELSRIPELEARRTRESVIEQLRASGPVLPKKALDPVRLVREDRNR